MSAREKIEGLTNAWYGFALFTTLISLLQNGFGFFWLLWTALSLPFSLFITFLIGRRLLAGSSLTRMILLVLGSLSALFGLLGSFKLVMAFLGSWELGTLLTLSLAVGSVWMNVRSIRVLTDASVKAHFR
jgi:hypothetical protein